MSTEILQFKTINSTNLYVKEHYKELNDNTLVVANEQTNGRGRRERSWLSPSGVNVYATLLIKELHDINFVGSIVALAALETIKEICPDLKPYIKWPNDIYIRDCKIAGILCESCEFQSGKISAVACGIGINVNLDEKSLKSIDQRATSLFFEKKMQFDLIFFTERLAFFTNKYYIIYKYNFSALKKEWELANKLINHELELIDSKGVGHFGRFVRISEEGELVLKVGEQEQAFNCGDVTLNKSSIQWDKLY